MKENMRTKHKYAEILHAVADGIPIQRKALCGTWEDSGVAETLAGVWHCPNGVEYYRVKPKTITIGGYEVVLPAKSVEKGSVYYFIDSCSHDGVCEDTFDGFEVDNRRIASGMCFTAREDAVLAAKAISALLKGE